MIQTELRDDILIVTLDRPERRNAMVPELMAALVGTIEQADQQPGLRGIVLAASGPAFCVGADLKWAASLEDPGAGIARLVAAHHVLVRALREATVPTVAAVNGAAAGGGMSLALACDYRLASPQASFTAAYFRLGLPPDGGNSAFLVRTVGAARAMELLLTNRSVSAEQALSLGLVQELAPPEQLVERALAAARAFQPVPAATLLAARRLLDSAASSPLDAQLDAEEAAMCQAAATETFRTAVEAFLRRA